jgi:hypothetical protein
LYQPAEQHVKGLSFFFFFFFLNFFRVLLSFNLRDKPNQAIDVTYSYRGADPIANLTACVN